MFKQIYNSEKSLNYLIRELSEMCDTVNWRIRLQEIKDKASKLNGDEFDYRFIQMITFSLRYDKLYYNYDKVIANIYKAILENGLEPNHSRIAIYCFNGDDLNKYSLQYGAGIANHIYDYYLKTTFACDVLGIRYSLINSFLDFPENTPIIDLMSILNVENKDISSHDMSVYPIPWTYCNDLDERIACIALLNLINTCYADTITQKEQYKNIAFNVLVKDNVHESQVKMKVSKI